MDNHPRRSHKRRPTSNIPSESRRRLQEEDNIDFPIEEHATDMNPLEALLFSMRGAEMPNRDRTRWLNVLRKYNTAPAPASTSELAGILNEMSDWLIMQGEDNVFGFDPSLYVPQLVRLVKGTSEFGPNIALLSLRCITNMIDVLPGSAALVVSNGGVDACCSKLATIEYIDLAEQAIAALVKVSKSEASEVRRANGPAAALTFIDFFDGATQQDCLAVSVNCSKDLGIEDIAYMTGCADGLVNLLTYSDRRLVEGAITTLSRIFSTFRGSWCDETVDIMTKFIKPNLVTNCINLLKSSNDITQGHAILILDMLDVLMLGDANQPCAMLSAGLGDVLYNAVCRFSSGSLMSSPAATTPTTPSVAHPTPQFIAAVLACAQNMLPPVPIDINDTGLMDQLDAVADEDDCSLRVANMKQNKEEYQSFAVKFLPIVSTLYKEKTMPVISRRVISIMTRMMYYCSSKEADVLASSLPLPRLLSTMLSGGDHVVVTRAILLVCIIVEKIGSKVVTDLKRNGVFDDVSRLASDAGSVWITEHVSKLSENANTSLDDTPLYVEVATAICEFISTPRVSRTGLRVVSGANSYQVPKKLEEFYFEAALQSGPIVPIEAFASCCLKGLRDILTGHDKCNKSMKITDEFAMVAETKCQTLDTVSLSSYEASRIGLAKSLSQFLSPKSHILSYDVRLEMFLKVFMNDNCKLLSPLLNLLLDSLGRLEQCPLRIHVAPAQSGSDISTRLRTLVTPIKLKIVPGVAEFVHSLVDYLRRTNKLAKKIRIEKMEINEPINTSSLSARTAIDGDSKRIIVKTDGTLPDLTLGMPSFQAMVEPSCNVESIGNFLLQKVVKSIHRSLSTEQEDHNDMESMLRRLARAIGRDEDEMFEDEESSEIMDDELLQVMSFLRLRFDGIEVPPYMSLLQVIESRGNPDIWAQEWILTYDCLPDIMSCVENGVRKQSRPRRRRERVYESLELHPDVQSLAPESDDLCSPYSFCYSASPKPPLSICEVTKMSIQERDLPDEAQSIIKLIRSLHFLVKASQIGLIDGASVNEYSFIDAGLDSKVRRQLQDPLTISTAYYPEYLVCLMHSNPYLFSLESRRLYFTAGALGRARALLLLQERTIDSSGTSNGDQELRVGRIPRLKVVVKRGSWMEAVNNVNEESTKNTKAVIEVAFEGEVGTGSGPTLEFFSSASRAFYATDMNLWRCNSNEHQEHLGVSYVSAPQGLYPKPTKPQTVSRRVTRSTFAALPEMYDDVSRDREYDETLDHYEAMGQLVGRAILDTRLVDLPLNSVFLRLVLGRPVVYNHLKLVDKMLYDSLALVDSNSGLDFTLPGDSSYELKLHGQDINVTNDNADEYRDLVAQHILHDGVMPQVLAFRKGLSSIIDTRWLDLFDESEILNMCVGDVSPWSIEDLQAHTRCDHGYTHTSTAVTRFFHIISTFDTKQRQDFIRFITGSSRLPIGGLAALRPQLTIVRKDPTPPNGPDAYLVSVMTCANYIKLPDYSSEQVMRSRLLTAMSEGADAFYLS